MSQTSLTQPTYIHTETKTVQLDMELVQSATNAYNVILSSGNQN